MPCIGYSGFTRNAPKLTEIQQAGGKGKQGRGISNCHGCCADGLREMRLAVAHEFAEFIEPVYFVAYLGDARIGARLHHVMPCKDSE